MYKRDKPKKENRHREQQQHIKNPSFSSTLLDQIYLSIDRNRINDMENPKEHRFLADTTRRKQIEASLHRKSRYDPHFLDKNGQDRFFGSRPSSSDSCSSVFSSSDTDLMYGKKLSRPSSCLGPSRPRLAKTDQDHCTLFYKNRAFQNYDDRNCSSATGRISKQKETLTKSKTHKKVKTPVSPGRRLVGFINSLFNNSKKSSMKSSSSSRKSCDEGLSVTHVNGDGFIQKSQDNSSTCSSAPSGSKFCLSKSSEKSCNAIKKNVTFSPVSVSVDDENREDRGTRLMSLSSPGEWKTRRPDKSMEDNDNKKIRRSVEEMARDFLRDYHPTRKKNEVLTDVFDDGDDDEDACSDSSSDLFEIDVTGNSRYREELPVYETTCAGLIM